MNLVVNEWLLEYFVPGTPDQSRANLLAFFDNIQNRKRKIVIGRETPFTSKFYHYMKRYGHDMQFKQNYRRLNELIFKDPLRTILVEKHEIKSVTDEDMIGVHSDDRYLLELVSTISGSIIVSTDTRLIEALAGRTNFPIIHLKDYLISSA